MSLFYWIVLGFAVLAAAYFAYKNWKRDDIDSILDKALKAK